MIALGPGNEEQVLQALAIWPQGMQFGGGVNEDNAAGLIFIISVLLAEVFGAQPMQEIHGKIFLMV